MNKVLTHLTSQKTLSKEQARKTLIDIGNGKHTKIEIAAFLMAFLMRPIQPQELAGFREAMLDLCVPVDFSEFNTVDVCGTGGDSKNTFNISTLAAFVVAGAGIKVVKHGNYGVSSPCGSSNVLAHFGYEFSTDSSKLKKDLEKSNICYLHAPLFHPAMKHVAPVRKGLKMKTFFNMLGPMVNPSMPKNQLVGVYNLEVMNLFYAVYEESECNFTIIHSDDGFDEVSLSADINYISNMGKGKLKTSDFGFNRVSEEELFGGETIDEAARIFKNILTGKGSQAQNEVVLSNAALAIKTVFPEKELRECVEMSAYSLKEGKALNSFRIFLG